MNRKTKKPSAPPYAQTTKEEKNSHSPVSVDIRILDVFPHAREENLELLGRPAQPALLLGTGEDGEGERAEAAKDVFRVPDAWCASAMSSFISYSPWKMPETHDGEGVCGAAEGGRGPYPSAYTFYPWATCS